MKGVLTRLRDKSMEQGSDYGAGTLQIDEGNC